MRSPANVIIADDHPAFRRGIAEIVAGVPEVGQIFEAGNGVEVLKLAQLHQPELAILDLAMPLMNGHQTMLQLQRLFPEVKTMVISLRTDSESVRLSLEAGAKGYLPKEADADEIEKAVSAVLSGEVYFSAQLSRQLVLKQPQNRWLNQLDERERQVLSLLSRQQTTAQIADKLGLSTRTVERLRSDILNKTGCATATGAVLFAERNGLLPEMVS